MATEMMAARPKLRILCFGDSLTAGYASMGCVYHPYRLKLEQMLEMAFPDTDVETVDDGRPGDTVKFGFLSRMQKNCSSSSLSGPSASVNVACEDPEN
jgi:lysophospholipase L1-like esterase